MLGFTNSNSGEWPQDFLCTYGELVIFSSEHKPLFILIVLCFMKRHVWKVSYYFHKTVNKYWNLFNLSEQSPENSAKNSRKFQKIQNFKFSLRKFQNLNFHFMKPYSPNSNIIITTYPYIYLYIQQSPTRL